MPNKEKHLEIVDQNYKALCHLTDPSPSNYTDWCTTIIFYMTLHYLHTYLAERFNNHPTAHINMQPIMINDTVLKPLYDKYRNLQDDSEDARYHGKRLSIYQLRNEVLKWFKEIQHDIFSLVSIHNRSEYDLYHLFPLD